MADDLEKLCGDVVDCHRCPRLVRWREKIGDEKKAAHLAEDYWARPVPGFGDPNASIVIVGLAPAAHGANRTGRMFTGDRSGDFLFAALHRAGYANQAESIHRDDGLLLRDVWVTSPVKCAPPQNKPTTTERDRCHRFLRRELALLDNAKVFIALGGFGYQALATFFGLRGRPAFGHGVVAPIGDGRSIVCSYHVSQLNTFTGRLTPEMFDAVLAQAAELSAAPPAA